MRLRKKRRNHTSGWKVLRRCVMLFSAVGVIPLLLVIFVATDNYIRPVRPITFSIRKAGSATDRLSGGAVAAAAAAAARNATATARRLEARRRLLRQRCSALGLDRRADDPLHRPKPWEFLVNDEHRLVWCNVFKAASTSWMYNFNILAGYSSKFLQKSKVVPMTLARQRYPRPSLEQLQKAINKSVSFIIVRHPLERLLSAYRDKLQHALPHTHHRKLGMEIVKKYRKNKKGGHGLPLQRWPTFSEFVQYLVDSVKKGELLDMHWSPIVEFCSPCMFNFTVIAHTETLQEDQEYLIKIAGLGKLIKPQWLNAGRGSTAPQIEKYYSQLTRSQILQLYHIYRFDFELFNYSLNGYLELGKPDPDPSSILAAITMKDTRLESMPQIY